MKTPMEYLIYYRVECAKERLKESNLYYNRNSLLWF